MPYMINFSPSHPFEYMRNKSLELFRIRWETFDNEEARWVRDDMNGVAWGFDHPQEHRIVRLTTAGKENTPKLGWLNPSYEVVEVGNDEEE